MGYQQVSPVTVSKASQAYATCFPNDLAPQARQIYFRVKPSRTGVLLPVCTIGVGTHLDRSRIKKGAGRTRGREGGEGGEQLSDTDGVRAGSAA